jgi:hypothetical protein
MFNANTERLRLALPAVARFHDENGGLTADHVAEIAQKMPHFLLLIRCGNGRFLTPAQNCKHFIDIIERDYKALEAKHGGVLAAAQAGADYVRDVSVPMPLTPA